MMIGLWQPMNQANTKMNHKVNQALPFMNLLFKINCTNQLKAPVCIATPKTPMHNTNATTAMLPKEAANIWFIPTLKPAPAKAIKLGHNISIVIQP